ncbi:hypothetical protein BC6307_19325 [Sutcliffiella cohnii]|uniref:Uncharacterized protein n=1 Tax=Sutcliffiella cohnii TaxID=33932 RepID=A0A223KV70_9BACI|nr:hypothetical protein [Sutcliffiella cohnii]AST93254.1 hypothetical protein BC6307_19325 [Sutcliffiella cohnii]
MSYLKSEDWRRLDKELQELKKRAEEAKAERIAAGLPPVSPSGFVPAAVIKYIYDNTDIKRLYAYVVSLAKLTLESNEVPPINPKEVLDMVPYYELLRWKDGGKFSSFRLSAAVSVFEKYDNYRTAEELARALYMATKMLRDEYGAYTQFWAPCLCDLEGRDDEPCNCGSKEHYEVSRILNEQVAQITDEYLDELLAEAREKAEIVRKERQILEEYRNGGTNDEKRN